MSEIFTTYIPEMFSRVFVYNFNEWRADLPLMPLVSGAVRSAVMTLQIVLLICNGLHLWNRNQLKN